jgi:hypothetical protein
MAMQLRIYEVIPGRMDAWVELFTRGTLPLRRAHGFSVRAWRADAAGCFVWLVEHAGSEAEFEAADRAYYALPEHGPLHEQALEYLVRGSAVNLFLEPVGEEPAAAAGAAAARR